MEPHAFYKVHREKLSEELKTLNRRKPVFGITRFGTLIALLAVFYFFSQLGWIYVILLCIILVILFRWLVLKDLANKAAISHLNRLVSINREEEKALAGEYFQYADGEQYIPKDHLYANDLDILGHASLYQFCNRTTSDMGAGKLADWLLHPAPAGDILMRQEAIKELCQKPNWLQQLRATGEENRISGNTRNSLLAWLQDPPVFINVAYWKWLRYLLPAVILSITIAAVFSWIPMNVLYAALLVAAVIAYRINKKIAPLHDRLSKMVNELATLSAGIALIENEAFKGRLLQEMQQRFTMANGAASAKVKQVKKILDRLDLRYNLILSAPLNLLLLWNLQQVLSLEKWKGKHQEDVGQWFDTLGSFEALISFATVSFNNPGWCFPLISDNYFEMEAQEMGHPLINAAKRINNDIDISHSGELMIVTGSNMAGKSTYLRSTGINIILAMAGAPACAKHLRISPVQLLSSMRVADNLEESTSTFYAELKKLKLIIDKVNANEKVFILLDEILRGTNSLDRRTGSVALVKQLIRHNASAIIATHDVSLAEMKKEFPENILNYHFDAHVSNDELYFDYKLKPGISTSLNASILMKKIGIEL